MIKSLLDIYNDAEQKILELFSYIPQWRDYPIIDMTEYYWFQGYENDFVADCQVVWAETSESLNNYLRTGDDVDCYDATLHDKPIYTHDHYSMLNIDTHIDCNIYLAIFDNNKRVIK